jgi:hypothetical protein
MRVTFEGKSYDAAALLVALHNNTRARGLGLLHETGPLTREEAESVLADSRQQWVGDERYSHGFVLDYVRGRPIKVTAEADGAIDALSQALYDRDAGAGAFQRALREAEASHG